MDPQKMEKSSRPLVAIILNWNGRRLLEKFLPEVIAGSDPSVTRIVVADNGSTDGSLEYLRAQFADKVDILAFSENLGFAQGYNRAILETGPHPYVALINSDLATDPGWDRILLRYMETHPDTGACQPKILSYDRPGYFEYAGACGGFLDRNAYPYCRGRIFGTCEPDNGQYDTPAEIFWASGAALVVQRELYLALGGLDPNFFAHMEEIDLCWRIQLAGYKIAVEPAASVRHLGGGSLPMGNPRKTYLNFRNNLLMMHKNLPDDVRSRALLRRRLLDTLAWLQAALTGKWADAKAIFKAHRDFADMRRRYVAHPAVNILPEAPGGQRNILWEYYGRRRHTYSRLEKNRSANTPKQAATTAKTQS